MTTASASTLIQVLVQGSKFCIFNTFSCTCACISLVLDKMKKTTTMTTNTQGYLNSIVYLTNKNNHSTV